MADPKAMEKKRTRQIAEILATVKGLVDEVAGLKAKEPETIELTAELDEAPDRTGEILAAMGAAFAEIREQQDRTLHACAMIAAEIAELKAETAGLKEQMTPATRRAKK